MIIPLSADRYIIESEPGHAQIASAIAVRNGVWVHWDGRTYFIEKEKPVRKDRRKGEHVADREVLAPMPGKVRQVSVEVGQMVQKGDLLIILEAMKMEHRLLAPVQGEVKAVMVEAGDIVDAGKELVEIE